MVYCTVTNDLTQDRRMQRIGESFVNNGWQFTLVGRKKRNSIALGEAGFKQRRLSCFFQKGPFFYLEINFRLLLYLIVCRPAIVYSVDLDTLSAGVIYKNLFGGQLIFDAHEYFEEVPELKGRPVIQWIWKRVAKWGIPHVDLAITVSDALAVELERQYQVHFKVIRNTRNRPHSTVAAKKLSLPFRMIYLGMYNPGRGLEELIEAMAYLEECELWLAGSGPLESHLKRLAYEKKVTHSVIFNNFLTGQKIEEFIAEGHLGCNLLHAESKSYYYSLANKTFDYMQYGLPGLHMKLPAYQAIHEKFNCLVLLENLTVTAIVEKVKALMYDESRFRNLSENNLIAARHYHWESDTQSLIEELKKLGALKTTSI